MSVIPDFLQILRKFTACECTQAPPLLTRPRLHPHTCAQPFRSPTWGTRLKICLVIPHPPGLLSTAGLFRTAIPLFHLNCGATPRPRPALVPALPGKSQPLCVLSSKWVCQATSSWFPCPCHLGPGSFSSLHGCPAPSLTLSPILHSHQMGYLFKSDIRPH